MYKKYIISVVNPKQQTMSENVECKRGGLLYLLTKYFYVAKISRS